MQDLVVFLLLAAYDLPQSGQEEINRFSIFIVV